MKFKHQIPTMTLFLGKVAADITIQNTIQNLSVKPRSPQSLNEIPPASWMAIHHELIDKMDG